MLHYLYYFETLNELKEKNRIVICCLSEMKDIVAPSSFSNFPVKLIRGGMFVFVGTDKSIRINL